MRKPRLNERLCNLLKVASATSKWQGKAAKPSLSDSKACLLKEYVCYAYQICRGHSPMNDSLYMEGCHNIMNQS